MDCDICSRQLSHIDYERSRRLGFKELVCGECLEIEWPAPEADGSAGNKGGGREDRATAPSPLALPEPGSQRLRAQGVREARGDRRSGRLSERRCGIPTGRYSYRE